MPYLLFYTDMDPHDMLRFILNRVTYTEYRDSISDMFESLKKEQRSRFAYLLMRAADNDTIYNYSFNGMKIGCEYLSNLICATFELIKTGQSFDDDYMEECRIIICELEKQIQKNLSDASSIDNIISLMNSNTFFMNKTVLGKQNDKNIESETTTYFKVNVVKNIKSFIINNQDNIIIESKINVNNMQANINNQNIIIQDKIDGNIYIDGNNQYDTNASESPKYKPASQKLWTWLKFVFAAIFAIATIALIILDHFLIALIPFVCMFAPFIIPKLCKSCCGCLPIVSSYVKDNKHDLDSRTNSRHKIVVQNPTMNDSIIPLTK